MIRFGLVAFLILGVCSSADQSQMMQKHQMKQMFQTVQPSEATLVQKGDQKLHCARCGMNLVKFYKTSHQAVGDKQTYQYCSIHCLAEHLKSGAHLKDFQVVDTKTLKFIPVQKAWYVVGSDVHGTMSHVSKYAFANKADALAFEKKHGGKVMNFTEAMAVARKDFTK